MRPRGALWLLLLLAACGADRRVAARPSGSDLSGTYRFTGMGELSPGQLPNPLIDFSVLAAPGEVVVTQNGHRLKASWVDGSGTARSGSVWFAALGDDVSWEDGVLTTWTEVPVRGPIILPGWARQFRGSRIFRAEDGDLHVVGVFEERGWMLFLFPFTDHHEDELVLERLDS